MGAALTGNFELKVEPGVLKDKADEVIALHTTMKTLFDEMKANVASTSGFWRGEAGDANRKAYNDLSDRIEDMLKRLGEHPVDLMKMAGVYDAAEAEAKEVGSALRGNVIV
ncbi:MAG: WXG100 family type VII secretion target [Lachnospiraceae bacterium]|nr:WXG100 family type VII secretion target [Lachnospiraceae bacterium]